MHLSSLFKCPGIQPDPAYLFMSVSERPGMCHCTYDLHGAFFSAFVDSLPNTQRALNLATV